MASAFCWIPRRQNWHWGYWSISCIFKCAFRWAENILSDGTSTLGPSASSQLRALEFTVPIRFRRVPVPWAIELGLNRGPVSSSLERRTAHTVPWTLNLLLPKSKLIKVEFTYQALCKFSCIQQWCIHVFLVTAYNWLSLSSILYKGIEIFFGIISSYQNLLQIWFSQTIAHRLWAINYRL